MINALGVSTTDVELPACRVHAYSDLEKIGAWASDYNHRRPHSSLGYKTPSQYAAKLNATGDRLRNPDQLRRSPVAQSTPLGVLTAETLTAAG